MSEPRQLRSYEYVNHPYASVRDTLQADAHGILQRATSTAATRASDLGATLRVEVAGLELATDVSIAVTTIGEAEDPIGHHPVTRFHVAWQARRHTALFPIMEAQLSVYPLSADETQLDLLGHYRPPGGVVGNALDALVGHRIAEATVHRFLQDVADYLKANARP
jgi:hypothetical protein